MNANAKMLYHYTSPGALMGIVQNRELWATHARYMNDSKELLQGLDIARQLIREVAEQEGKALAEQKSDWLIKDLGITGPDHSMPTYVVSFSEERDRLSQWRAYGQGGGFAIGFDREALSDSLRSSGREIVLKKCEYNSARQQAMIHKVIQAFARPWIVDPTPEPFDRQEGPRFAVSGKLQWALAEVVDRIKNSGFSEENEWRLSTMPGTVSLARKDVCFRPRGGMLIPYTKVQLPEDPKAELWRTFEVIVGPTRFPERSKESLRMMLRSETGMAPCITVSEIPYIES